MPLLNDADRNERQTLFTDRLADPVAVPEPALVGRVMEAAKREFPIHQVSG